LHPQIQQLKGAERISSSAMSVTESDRGDKLQLCFKKRLTIPAIVSAPNIAFLTVTIEKDRPRTKA
jgi:hypothetical protein